MSTSTTAVVSAACIGAAVCASVYVIWGSDGLFRKRGEYRVSAESPNAPMV